VRLGPGLRPPGLAGLGSFDGGASWQGLLGLTSIAGGTDAHTVEFDDAGVLMRACANDGGNTGTTHCTDWY
jgi:hypothetical protein